MQNPTEDDVFCCKNGMAVGLFRSRGIESKFHGFLSVTSILVNRIPTKKTRLRGSFIWLGTEDLNLDMRSQSPVSYR